MVTKYTKYEVGRGIHELERLTVVKNASRHGWSESVAEYHTS